MSIVDPLLSIDDFNCVLKGEERNSGIGGIKQFCNLGGSDGPH